jgi:hypothetical protein
MEYFGPLLFWIVLAGIIGFAGYRMIRYGGFKASIFGAKIVSTTGEISLHGVPFATIVLKVHVLGGDDPSRAVGIERVSKSFLRYEMHPATLSRDQATQLAALLQRAASDSQLAPR